MYTWPVIANNHCAFGNIRLLRGVYTSVLYRLLMTKLPIFLTNVLLLVTLSLAGTAQSVSSNQPGFEATFAASNGDVIKLSTRTGTLETPRSRGTGLKDCSDKFQVCLTDHHRFAFAYFRRCNDATSGAYKRLRFDPKVVSVLHNSDVWMVFNAAPNYLFHYAYSKGIVGIYVGRTPSFDFRTLLQDRNLHLDRLDAQEYRITSSELVAACSL
jgi:hypothetical protein